MRVTLRETGDLEFPNKWIAIGEDNEFTCRCGEACKEGFLCKLRGVICNKCQEVMNQKGNSDMLACQMACGEDEHSHIKFIRESE